MHGPCRVLCCCCCLCLCSVRSICVLQERKQKHTNSNNAPIPRTNNAIIAEKLIFGIWLVGENDNDDDADDDGTFCTSEAACISSDRGMYLSV